MRRIVKLSMYWSEQAGNGPNRRHIQGSKIAKGLQNFQVLVNWDYFYENIFEKKCQCRKKLKVRTLWDFSTSISCETPKNWREAFVGKKVFLKKVSQCRKNGPFGLVRYCMLRGKPFWFSSLGQQVHFGVFWKFCRTFGRTILVSSGGLKKTLTKSHDYSRLFSKEKRRLKMTSFSACMFCCSGWNSAGHVRSVDCMCNFVHQWLLVYLLVCIRRHLQQLLLDHRLQQRLQLVWDANSVTELEPGPNFQTRARSHSNSDRTGPVNASQTSTSFCEMNLKPIENLPFFFYTHRNTDPAGPVPTLVS